MENSGKIWIERATMKKTFASNEKAEVALAALKGELTISQISSRYQVHPTQIGLWKKQAKEILLNGFSDKRKRYTEDQQKLTDELYQIIGKRDAELSWLKKKLLPFNTP